MEPHMEQSNTNARSTDNPWFYWGRIWFQPRETMRKLLDQPTNIPHVLILLLLGGFAHSLNHTADKNLADSFATGTLITYFIIGTLIGAVFLYYVIGGLLYWIGTLLGGSGSYCDVRLSLAYAYVPKIATLVLWIPLLLLFGGENFSSYTPGINSSELMSGIFTTLLSIKSAFIIWEIIVILLCFGEAHQFSVWKSLLTFVIMFVVMIVLIVVLVFLFSLAG